MGSSAGFEKIRIIIDTKTIKKTKTNQITLTFESELASQLVINSQNSYAHETSEKVDGQYVIRNKVQFKITRLNNTQTLFESECLTFSVICCHYLNANKINYSMNVNIHFKFTEKLENLAEIYSKKSPSIAINETMFDNRDEYSKLFNSTDLNFNFSEEFFKNKSLTNEMIAPCLEQLMAIYIGCDSVQLKEPSCNSIELEKDEIEKIIFRKSTLTELEYFLEIFANYFSMDKYIDLQDFLEDHE